MFALFKKDQTKKLRKEYEDKLSQAMTAQRNGDIRAYSILTEEAEQLYRRIQATQVS